MADDTVTCCGPRNWRERLGRVLRTRPNRVVGHTSDPPVQQHPLQELEEPVTQSLESVTTASFETTVDFPVEYAAGSTQPAAEGPHATLPSIFISRTSTSSEPVGHPQMPKRPVPQARSTVSARSNLSIFGAERGLKSLFHVWDNRLALKLFGSRRGILKEEERLKNCQHWVIHPCSKFRIYWDLLMLIVLTLNVVALPVAIAFFHETINPGWITLNCFSDAIFIFDILLNFWTGVISEENTVILDLKEIQKLYAKKWLAIDILSVFPFDYIFLGLFKAQSVSSLLEASRALRLLRLIKVLGLLRLFRVVRFMHYLAKWEELFTATRSIARIINFVMAVLLLAHWNGCIQFLVPYIQGFPPDSWVSINNLQNASVGTQYSWAVFKAMSHMLCIGFGRWPPQNTTEVWITIISMLIGASLYAMFIGHISTLIHSVHSASRKYNEKLKQVEEYMRYRKLPFELKIRVHEYYYQKYRGQLFDEEAILKELSLVITEDIVKFNCQELVRVVPFFADADSTFIISVITRLKFDVFLPGDYVIRCGAIGTKMYFIQHGVVDVITSDGNVATCLCDGSYFGEICLLMKCRRVASVRAVTVCDLYCLAREDFELVLDEFPHMRRIMETVANERLAMIRRTVVPTESRSQQVTCASTTGACTLLSQPLTRANQYAPTLNTIASTSVLSSGDYTNPEDVV